MTLPTRGGRAHPGVIEEAVRSLPDLLRLAVRLGLPDLCERVDARTKFTERPFHALG